MPDAARPRANCQPGADRLERRYRRLLWAYPRRYRRQRGAEILATLLDGAEPGRTRPSVKDATDVVSAGLRHRLRAAGGGHSGRVAVAAVAVAGFVIGAAGGSWLGWRSAPPLLADRQYVAATAQTIFPDVSPQFLNTAQVDGTAAVIWTPHPFGYEGAGLRRPDAPWRGGLLAFIAGEDNYQSEQIAIFLDATGPRTQTIAATQARMRSAGWVVGNADTYGFIARRGDLLADVTFGDSQVGIPGQQEIDYRELRLVVDRRHDPAPVLPATVGGALLGLGLAWLLAASATRRLARHRPAVRATAGVLVVCALSCCVPLVAFTATLVIQYFLTLEPNTPLWAGTTIILFRPLALTGAVFALILLALIGLIRPAEGAHPTTKLPINAG